MQWFLCRQQRQRPSLGHFPWLLIPEDQPITTQSLDRCRCQGRFWEGAWSQAASTPLQSARGRSSFPSRKLPVFIPCFFLFLPRCPHIHTTFSARYDSRSTDVPEGHMPTVRLIRDLRNWLVMKSENRTWTCGRIYPS
jgi:hypothetical protein